MVEGRSTESIKRIVTGLSMILAPLLLAVGFAIPRRSPAAPSNCR
jgi:hypothetical protein